MVYRHWFFASAFINTIIQFSFNDALSEYVADSRVQRSGSWSVNATTMVVVLSSCTRSGHPVSGINNGVADSANTRWRYSVRSFFRHAGE